MLENRHRRAEINFTAFPGGMKVGPASKRVSVKSRNEPGKSASLQPFLKWPGGKRWLAPSLMRLIADVDYGTYREPFLGGGALFFAMRPKIAVLSDINKDLINTYRQVKLRSQDLIDNLHDLTIDRETYHFVRESVGGSPTQRAIRFLYLNRTSFGGMYRVNRRGQFNVPFGGGGRTTDPLWNRNLLASAAKALRNAKLRAIDFEEAFTNAERGDLIYCDPTYTVAHNNNGFIRYNERNFSWEGQKRLARCCLSASARGVTVIVSNAYHRELLHLFRPPLHFLVSRASCLCPKSTHRRSVHEYVFVFPAKSKRKAFLQKHRHAVEE